MQRLSGRLQRGSLPRRVGLSRLCSATFEQLFAVLATSSKFWAIYMVSSTYQTRKRHRFHRKLQILFYFIFIFKFIVDLFLLYNLFYNLFLIFFFNSFFLIDVGNYCEERKMKLLINVNIKISRNLEGNFWNLVATFWIFGKFLATFWHSSDQLSSILRAQSGKA